MKRLFTSESVTEGHPDKACDLISDNILDYCLTNDKNSRVACETMMSGNKVYIVGEITTKTDMSKPIIENEVRNVLKQIGYSSEDYDINPDTCEILIDLKQQSPDIAQGVNNAEDNENTLGAGDQGLMFGYACNETKEYMPLPIILAHTLAKRLTAYRHEKDKEIEQLEKEYKDGKISKHRFDESRQWMIKIRPDGKVQVTIEYEDEKPIRVDTILISTQHEHLDNEVQAHELWLNMVEEVIHSDEVQNLLKENGLKWESDTKVYVNPTGKFEIGGPLGDAGLTGRKIIVDTYGGYARHGGGCFSRKRLYQSR